MGIHTFYYLRNGLWVHVYINTRTRLRAQVITYNISEHGRIAIDHVTIGTIFEEEVSMSSLRTTEFFRVNMKQMFRKTHFV